MNHFIQCKTAEGLETVDEFNTRKEAKEALAEYIACDWANSGNYYISNRCCKEWKDAGGGNG